MEFELFLEFRGDITYARCGHGLIAWLRWVEFSLVGHCICITRRHGLCMSRFLGNGLIRGEYQSFFNLQDV